MRERLMIFFTLILITHGGAQEMKDSKKSIKIRIIKDSTETVFLMENNAAVRDFMALLPITLNLSDYNRTEKVSGLPSKLSTEGLPSGYDPDVGDICLYAPWGNLCIFYRDFEYAGGLVKLGHAVSGIELLRKLDGPVKIVAEDNQGETF